MTIPGKDPHFEILKPNPLNAEPPRELLLRSFRTPAELFYVRNHGNIPEVDAFTYRLLVRGLVERPLELSMDALRTRFTEVEVTATLECAGNRRRELMDIDPVDGEPWREGAIGTAAWSGVRLRDVLEEAGCDARAKHVAFTSLDSVEQDGDRFAFGASIPLDKAQRPEVILAYAMNGAPLPKLHGHPLRVVVPGYLGARSVKWLASINLQEEPSDNYFQQKAYKLLPPDMDAAHIDWKQGLTLGELPVNAAICVPTDGAVVTAGPLEVRGYAFAGGGRAIERVEISLDAGEHWRTAELEEAGDGFSWRLFRAQVEVTRGEVELIVRAWDAAAQTQPSNPEETWNAKGYVNNAWHRVRVTAR